MCYINRLRVSVAAAAQNWNKPVLPGTNPHARIIASLLSAPLRCRAREPSGAGSRFLRRQQHNTTQVYYLHLSGKKRMKQI